jgi:ribosomal protein L24
LNGNKGKVTGVYRRRWYITVDKITKQKINGKDIKNNNLLILNRCNILSSFETF